MKIADVLAELRAAAQHLEAEHPDLAADERAWTDTLDGLTDGLDLAEYLAERVLHLEAMECAALQRAKALQARAKRFEAEQDRLRALILALVDAAGGKKVVRAALTLSPRNTPPRIIATDPAATPAEYLQTVTKTEPDKTKIKEALEMGAVVEGWMRSNGGRSLAIKVA
jgi:hypothetical protein